MHGWNVRLLQFWGFFVLLEAALLAVSALALTGWPNGLAVGVGGLVAFGWFWWIEGKIHPPNGLPVRWFLLAGGGGLLLWLCAAFTVMPLLPLGWTRDAASCAIIIAVAFWWGWVGKLAEARRRADGPGTV